MLGHPNAMNVVLGTTSRRMGAVHATRVLQDRTHPPPALLNVYRVLLDTLANRVAPLPVQSVQEAHINHALDEQAVLPVRWDTSSQSLDKRPVFRAPLVTTVST